MTEQISALIDGELDQDQADAALRALGDSASQREDWRRYALIGDCLRGERTGRDISASVLARLAGEPTVLAPTVRRTTSWAQRTLAMAATVTAVALVAWASLRAPVPGRAPGLAATPAATVTGGTMQTRAQGDRDGRAYRQVSQGAQSAPAGYVRTVDESGKK